MPCSFIIATLKYCAKPIISCVYITMINAATFILSAVHVATQCKSQVDTYSQAYTIILLPVKTIYIVCQHSLYMYTVSYVTQHNNITYVFYTLVFIISMSYCNSFLSAFVHEANCTVETVSEVDTNC